MALIKVATDGASKGNGGASGWSWYVNKDNWAAGSFAKATNNIAELTAVLELLRSAGREHELEIYCDSQYVINCLTKWRFGWKKNGWLSSKKEPVANKDLMMALDEQLTGRKVKFIWVRGHNGHLLNEAADRRASAAALSVQMRTLCDKGPGFNL